MFHFKEKILYSKICELDIRTTILTNSEFLIIPRCKKMEGTR